MRTLNQRWHYRCWLNHLPAPAVDKFSFSCSRSVFSITSLYLPHYLSEMRGILRSSIIEYKSTLLWPWSLEKKSITLNNNLNFFFNLFLLFQLIWTPVESLLFRSHHSANIKKSANVFCFSKMPDIASNSSAIVWMLTGYSLVNRPWIH